jgi:predicted phosphoadenosine phosphosulfate sulfurtransferase
MGESGNISGYNRISKPEGYTWEGFCNLLLRTMPPATRDHYVERFRKFIAGWKARGYDVIPDEAPLELEAKCWAPSWRRMCKVLLRNDYWCKSLGQTQPKSLAWQQYKALKAEQRQQLSEAVDMQETGQMALELAF